MDLLIWSLCVCISCILSIKVVSLFPSMKPYKIGKNDKITKLVHYTNLKGKIGIENSKELMGSSKWWNYSNEKTGAIFFVGDDANERIVKFNRLYQYEYKLEISPIPERIMNDLYIRDYDKTIIYHGNISFEDKPQIVPVKNDDVVHRIPKRKIVICRPYIWTFLMTILFSSLFYYIFEMVKLKLQ